MITQMTDGEGDERRRNAVLARKKPPLALLERFASELRVAAVTFSEMRPSPSRGSGLLSSSTSSSGSVWAEDDGPDSAAAALRPRAAGAGRLSSAMTRLMEASISSIDGSWFMSPITLWFIAD